MPTLSCPNCGQTVRFEGVAGICPSCASVVMVPKSADAPRPKPAKIPKTGRPGLETLQDLAGHEAEVFEPANEPLRTIGGMDPGIAITLGVVALLLVMFVLYLLVHSMSGSTAANAPVVRSTAPPPSRLTEPVEPAVPAAPVVTPTPSPATAPSPQGPPPPAWTLVKPVRPPAEAVVNNANIIDAITRGIPFLIDRYKAGVYASEKEKDNAQGRDALATYALLHADDAIHDRRLNSGGPFMTDALAALKSLSFDEHSATYDHSLRATALSLLNRPTDRGTLINDLNWLLKSSNKGAYTYQLGDSGYDNSNSQYGALGVWSCSDAGLSVPTSYWDDVEAHWLSTQEPDGGWGYTLQGLESSATMTAAGITSLTVSLEQRSLVSTRRDSDPRPKLTKAVNDGVTWLGLGDRSVHFETHKGYASYGMERAALASGFKFFGHHDWYRELAAIAISDQNADGSWTGNDGPGPETAFRLLFLSRGLQPLLMNKLRFDGKWNNRPRDLAKLSQFCSARLEQTFAWGIADLDRNWSDWLDAPVLLLSTDAPPPLDEATVHKFRRYTDNGGLLLIHNEFATPEMDAFVADLARRAYPEFPLKDLPADSVVSNAVVNLQNIPPLKAISNGTRTLVVYSPTDITRRWVVRRPLQIEPASQLGMNIFVYAAGKDHFKHRLDTSSVPPSVIPSQGTIPVARIQYPGQWDPEPAAYTRFVHWFQDQTSLAADLRPMDAAELNAKEIPVATLTGVGAVDFTKMNLPALRKYVDDGGILLIDACGGSIEFAKSVRAGLLPGAFADVQLTSLDGAAPVLAGAGACMDPLPKPNLRQSAIVRLGGVPAQVDAANVGKGMLLVSDMDITAGLLDTGTLSIIGYTPEYCQSLVKNILLWSVRRLHP